MTKMKAKRVWRIRHRFFSRRSGVQEQGIATGGGGGSRGTEEDHHHHHHSTSSAAAAAAITLSNPPPPPFKKTMPPHPLPTTASMPPSSLSSSSPSPPPSRFPQLPLLFHIGAVLSFLYIASFFHFSSVWMFALSFLYLFEADQGYIKRIHRRIRSEERRFVRQERPLSDVLEVDWLNQVIEKVWVHFLEKFISRDLLGPMIPWFLDKFKPGTVGKVALLHLYLGRRPPIFTGARIIEKATEDDHLVMELGLDFLAAEDMDVILNAQLRGLGIWSNIHISKLQIEGKVRVGLKFTTEPPYLTRLRLCFESAPYVQMTARPLFSHNVNVAEMPLISGFIDRMIADVFKKSLVEPNMVVVDVEKLVNSIATLRTTQPSTPGNWFDIQEKKPIAIVHLGILEALDLKASDLNGLSDPFVKATYTTTQLKTKIEKNTLNPKWNENFEVPIISWDVPDALLLHVYDKDPFRDDKLGYCTIKLMDYRGGQLHDLWLPLQSVRTGRLHLTVQVIDTEQDTGLEQKQSPTEDFTLGKIDKANNLSVPEPPVEDKCETMPFMSLVSPGQPSVVRNWEQRSQKGMRAEKGTTESSQNNEAADGQESVKTKSELHVKIEPLIADNAGDDDSSPMPTELISAGRNEDENSANKNEDPNLAAANEDVEDNETIGADSEQADNDQISGGGSSPPVSTSGEVPDTPGKKAKVKEMAKGLMKQAGKQAGKTARSLRGAMSRKGSMRDGNQ